MAGCGPTPFSSGWASGVRLWEQSSAGRTKLARNQIVGLVGGSRIVRDLGCDTFVATNPGASTATINWR
jgi:hypothetical protein